MKRRRPYRIDYAPDAVEHLEALTRHQASTVLDTVQRQLAWEPTVPTRNRGPMRPNPPAGYRLRIGDLRVLYDVDEGEHVVRVRAVGVKVHNRLSIGGQEFDL